MATVTDDDYDYYGDDGDNILPIVSGNHRTELEAKWTDTYGFRGLLRTDNSSFFSYQLHEFCSQSKMAFVHESILCKLSPS